ncbi:MAG TPA: anthranilate phosphoribosyltransferase [bacterium]|nr:anthranilate phosphoribosyltransferase [bacterium]
MAAEGALAWKAAFARVLKGEALDAADAEAAMTDIMEGRVPQAAIAGYLVALRMKGETPEEVVGSARAMRRASTRIQPKRSPLLDTCGTGGDESGTLNFSTAAAIVAAAAGAAVAKHGNRSVSSRCGSADVLQELGVAVDAEPEHVERSVERHGFGFLFSPRFHPAMRHAMGARRALATRTIFNLLGPMTNPAGAHRQVMGVYSLSVLELAAEALRLLGTERAFVLHSADGMDEVSLAAPTHVIEVTKEATRRFQIDADAIGVAAAPMEAIRGGDAPGNAETLLRVFRGEKGAVREGVVANAALALVAADLAEDFREGAEKARAAIDRGAALALLESLRREKPG